jgi:tripartite-type tricarboxylate transporter receptor subunit TctC
MEEAGIANAESETLQVLLGPQNMPDETTDRLSKAVVKALAAPELREQLLKTGFAVSGTGPAELKQLTSREVAKWRDVIAEAKLTVN